MNDFFFQSKINFRLAEAIDIDCPDRINDSLQLYIALLRLKSGREPVVGHQTLTPLP